MILFVKFDEEEKNTSKKVGKKISSKHNFHLTESHLSYHFSKEVLKLLLVSKIMV